MDINYLYEGIMKALTNMLTKSSRKGCGYKCHKSDHAQKLKGKIQRI